MLTFKFDVTLTEIIQPYEIEKERAQQMQIRIQEMPERSRRFTDCQVNKCKFDVFLI